MKAKVISAVACAVAVLIVLICCEYRQEDELADVIVGEMHDYTFDDSGINNYRGMELDSTGRILSWVTANIEHSLRTREVGGDYWQLPEETYKAMAGDCEDICILFMYLLREKLDIDSNLILTQDRHTIVYVASAKKEEQYVDVVNGSYLTEYGIHSTEFIWVCPYPQVIWMTYYYHDNVGIYR